MLFAGPSRGRVGSVASKEGRREIDGELGLELGLQLAGFLRTCSVLNVLRPSSRSLSA